MFNESCKIYERYPNTPSEVAQQIYYYPQWYGHFLCSADFCIEREAYDSILIIRTTQGAGQLTYRGKEYLLQKGDFAIINCNDYHKYVPKYNDWGFDYLHFKGPNHIEFYEHIFTTRGTCIFTADTRMQNLLEECVTITKTKTPYYEPAVSEKITKLIYALILQPQNTERSKIRQACDYIIENHKQSINTQELAEFVSLSRSYFSTLFKKATGTTPHDYLICYRINLAKSMLLGAEMSVSKIAEHVGFEDSCAFIRAFKRKEGISPLQYRKGITKSTLIL